MGFFERRRTLVVVLPLAIAAAALAVWSVSAPSAPAVPPEDGTPASPQRSWLGDLLIALGRILIGAGDRLDGGPAGASAPGPFADVADWGPVAIRPQVERGLYLVAGVVSASVAIPQALWSTPAVAAPLVVLGTLWIRRRAIPSVSLSGRFYQIATTHGPAPPLLQPLFRISAMCILAAALVAPLGFHPLLGVSAALLTASILSGLRRASRGRHWLRRIPGLRLLESSPLATLAAAQMAGPAHRRAVLAVLAAALGLIALTFSGAFPQAGQGHLATLALLLVASVTLVEILVKPASSEEDWESALGEVIGVTVVESPSPRPPAPGGSGSPSPLSLLTSQPFGLPAGLWSPGIPLLVPGGNDPEDRREYVEGDDIRAIDWKATARTGKRVTKLSSAASETSLWFLVDFSASTRSGVAAERRSLMSLLCTQLAWNAAFKDFRLGLAIFTTDIEKVVEPQVGKHHSNRIAVALRRFAPRARGTDAPKAIKSLRKHLRGPGKVLVVSDFSDSLSPALVNGVRALMERGQEVIAVRVADPLDEELPNLGVAYIENPETGEARLVDTSDPELARIYRTESRALREDLKHKLDLLGVPLVEVRTTDTPGKWASHTTPPQEERIPPPTHVAIGRE